MCRATPQSGGTLVDPGPKESENSCWKGRRWDVSERAQCGSVGPCLDFVIRISLGSFFFYIKYGHTLGNAQNVRACHSIFRGCLCASVCTGRVRPHTKGNIKAYSWCRDADAVGKPGSGFWESLLPAPLIQSLGLPQPLPTCT